MKSKIETLKDKRDYIRASIVSAISESNILDSAIIAALPQNRVAILQHLLDCNAQVNNDIDDYIYSDYTPTAADLEEMGNHFKNNERKI